MRKWNLLIAVVMGLSVMGQTHEQWAVELTDRSITKKSEGVAVTAACLGIGGLMLLDKTDSNTRDLGVGMIAFGLGFNVVWTFNANALARQANEHRRLQYYGER